MIIGIAGKMGTGKSLAAHILRAHGYRSIDVDHLGHKALIQFRDRVAAEFEGITTEGGDIDRKKLGAIVFAHAGALRRLEQIVHPPMAAEAADIIRRLQTEEGIQNIVIDAALLYKIGLDRLCDKVIWMTSPLPVRVLRSMRRMKIWRRGFPALRSLVQRIYTQRNFVPHPRSAYADIYIVYNIGSKKRLVQSLARIGVLGERHAV